MITTVVLLVAQALSQELSSTLHSTPNGIQFAYPGEMVVFTCEVRGSNNLILMWESDQYIGVGQRLTLAPVEPNGTVQHASGNSETFAVLSFANVDGANVVIVSQLHIRIDSTYSVASVHCVNDSAHTRTSTSFLLAGRLNITIIQYYTDGYICHLCDQGLIIELQSG